MGVALMFALGLRNSEACALDFGDIREIPDKPNNYCIWIYKTTTKNTNDVKAGGKTKNADRIIPLTSYIANFFLSRKNNLINQMLSGAIPTRPEISSVDDLPIACVGHDYTTRSNANLLSAAGKRVLQEAALDSKVLGYISKTINDMPVLEKEPTAYLFRRNFATHLHILGLDEAEIQYIVGHEIEDTSEMRNFFTNTDKLWPIKLKMDNRPLVSDYYYCRRQLLISDKSKHQQRAILMDDINSSGEQQITLQPSDEKDWKIRINAAATEPQEKIQVNIESRNIDQGLHASMFVSEENKTTGISNVLKAYHEAYDNALSKMSSDSEINETTWL